MILPFVVVIDDVVVVVLGVILPFVVVIDDVVVVVLGVVGGV